MPDSKSWVEQITIALIYKFMDDMDRQSEELGGVTAFFSGEFIKYAWSRLLDKNLGGHERLQVYAEGIAVMDRNPSIPQIFRDMFKGAFLPYRDPETVNLFLKEINGFSYDHSERPGDAFEYPRPNRCGSNNLLAGDTLRVPGGFPTAGRCRRAVWPSTDGRRTYTR